MKRRDKNFSCAYGAFVEPRTLEELAQVPEGLKSKTGKLFKLLSDYPPIFDFSSSFLLEPGCESSLAVYDLPSSIEWYENSLAWLLKTFDQQEESFREELLGKLNIVKGQKVLIVGCGLGGDLPLVKNYLGDSGEIHAQDLSARMVLSSSEKFSFDNLYFSISDARALPYRSRYFDAVFHFGGINLFGDIRQSISELERVCKIGGIVMFGDEGVAPHLKNTEYGKMVINNNPLWASEAPLNFLPENAQDLQLSYVLGNCFYLICFRPGQGFPQINIDVPHKGIRGGTIRTRYYGQVEAVTELTKQKLVQRAKKQGSSIHDLLEQILAEQL